MPKQSVLVVDDEVSIRKALARSLEREGYLVTTVKSSVEAEAVSKDKEYDLVVTDLILPDGNGIELVRSLQSKQKCKSSIIITGNATVESAIAATRQGVFHYVTKPFNIDEVLVLVDKAIEHSNLSQQNKHLKRELKRTFAIDNFVGDSEPMLKVIRLVERVADTDSTVLITGESGTGKEIVARALHYNSSRSDKIFVPVNCGAIPLGLLESELFGHVKGAFPGALNNRDGRFKAADNGTLFLDEMGEMPPDLQVKILRVLQNKSIEPVGSVKSIEVDARIIAATNVDLDNAVQEKQFREDLYYRLNVIPIVMPPLRERRSDVPLLIHHFLEIYNNEKGCDVLIRDDMVINAFASYDWPGNVRELENLIQRIVILKGTGEVELRDLPTKILSGSRMRVAQSGSFTDFELPDEGVCFKELVTAFEDHLLAQALSRTHGNKNKASELLKMNRTTLVEKLKKRQVLY